MSRRNQITMTDDEVMSYLEEEKVINVATIGPNGRPHLAPLWYYPSGTGVATWTYASSQKTVNLRRLAEATVLIESGDAYENLRGVSMETDVEIITDTATLTGMGRALMRRYSGIDHDESVPDELHAFVAGQAPKRVGLVFNPTKIVSWDHRKLGGAY